MKTNNKKDILEYLKKGQFHKQFVYSFLPVIFFESTNNCYLKNPLVKKLGLKKLPSFVVLWKNNYEDWSEENIQKIKDKKQILFIVKENRNIVKKHKKQVGNLLNLDCKKLTNKELVKVLKTIDKISTEIYHRYIFLIHDWLETDDKKLIELLPKVRIEMSEFVSVICKICDNVIDALSGKFNKIPWQTFMYATFDETINLLERPRSINKFKKIHKRHMAFVFNGKKLFVIKDQEKVKKIINTLKNQKSQKQKIKNINEIKGNVVFEGVAKGKVFKVSEFNYEKIGKALKNKKDYILVTPMTRPEFLPYMRNCKAIITDEGGVTCHAAIVARELKKPCLVATKIATKVLKDGDLVEVDAEKGIVKILKKK